MSHPFKVNQWVARLSEAEIEEQERIIAESRAEDIAVEDRHFND